MNERIKQLAEQAFDKANNGTISDIKIPKEFIEKFAELIVKECVSTVENLSPGYQDYRNQIEDAFRRDCVEQIKQHFGVEE
jgi:lipoate-protein ligase A